MLIVQNRYYPLPGREAEVIATRREASRVLGRLGVASGELLFPVRANVAYHQPGAASSLHMWPDGATGGPAGATPMPDGDNPPVVVWQVTFASREEFDHNLMNIVGPSSEFTRVREKMSTLLRRFESILYEVDGTDRPQ
jgi:hypothetical protein